MSTTTLIKPNPVDVASAIRLQELENQFQPCLNCNTRQMLTDTWVQKKKFGGIHSDDNVLKGTLCPACNAEYTLFAETFSSVTDFEQWKEIFVLFLKIDPEKLSSTELMMAQLRELAGLRMELHEEGQRFLGRYSMRAKRLDDLVDVNVTSFSKEAKEVASRMKSKRVPGWLDVLMAPKAEIDGQKELLEKQIARLIKDHPVWSQFGDYIPGVGPWTIGFLMAKITDPRRFPDSSALRGYAGLRIDEEGRAQGRQRFTSPRKQADEKKSLDFSPSLKTMVCKLIPDAMSYQKTRFPESPYSQEFGRYKEYLLQRVTKSPPQACQIKGCSETDLVNLGWETTEDGGKKFLGYCCAKTHGKVNAHKFYNPAHINNMVNRRVGSFLLCDLYHIWLWFLGENPRIEGNPRIMWVLDRAKKG